MSDLSQNRPLGSFFPVTRWFLVVRAQGDNPDAKAALEVLCQTYWYPIYSFARYWGLSPHDAEDSTQAFFQKLLANQSLGTVAAERGRLRSFLLAPMKNYLSSRKRDAQAQKRGGGQPLLSIDQPWAEETLAERTADAGADAEVLFDRNWAFSLLNAVSRRLEAHYDKIGKRDVYEAIKGCLEGDGSYESGRALAARIGMTEEGIRSAVFKLRRRFREYIEEAVRDTCSEQSEVSEEIAHLCRILAY